MSFATEIKTVMTSDPSLNEMIDGGIRYENLTDNWLGDSNDNEWIVYEFNINEQQDCLTSKNLFLNYTLNVTVMQRNSNDEIDNISSRLLTYLNNYESGNIIDIGFVNDNGGFSQQKGVYLNVLQYNCIYIDPE